jgi:hypothetical protein
MRRRHGRIGQVRVKVNEARRNQLAPNVHHLRCIRRRDVPPEIGDSPSADGDVHDPVEALTRVYHAPALEEQIVLSREQTRRSGNRNGACCCGLKELTSS